MLESNQRELLKRLRSDFLTFRNWQLGTDLGKAADAFDNSWERDCGYWHRPEEACRTKIERLIHRGSRLVNTILKLDVSDWDGFLVRFCGSVPDNRVDYCDASAESIDTFLLEESMTNADTADEIGPLGETRTSDTPSIAETEKDEGNSRATSPAAQPQDSSDAARKAARQKLEPAVRNAYLACLHAEQRNGRRLEDHEAYDWLHEHGIDQDKGDLGELTEYELPDSFETFKRYLVTARSTLGENKYTRRAGRKHGGSIAPKEQIE
jgi:hypothetical protein